MTNPDPIYLTTVRAICREMRISAATIQHWIGQGAPIGVTTTPKGRTRYTAEKHELMRWIIRKKKHDKYA